MKMKTKGNKTTKIMKALMDKINKASPKELQDALDYLNSLEKEGG